MATAQTIISDALKEICVLAEDETPTATMANDALRALNRLMELWSNDQSFAYVANTVSKALTGQSSFTIGPTGDVVTLRPIRIETATVDRGGITYPVRVVDNQLFDSIAYKALAGANTSMVYYAAEMPDGIVNVWPISTGCTLNLRVINLVNSFPNLATVLEMPPGYEHALIMNLAVSLAPQYSDATLSKLTLLAAKSSMKAIKNTNNLIPTMEIDGSLLNRRGGSIASFMGGY